MPQQAVRGLIFRLLPALAILSLLAAASGAGAVPGLAQERTLTATTSQDATTTATSTATPAPTATPPQPTPTRERLESDEDVLTALAPREQRPRDNDIRFDHISIEHGLSQSTI